jgi:hypothetical protein
MRRWLRDGISSLMILTMTCLLMTSPGLANDEHVLTSKDLHQAVLGASQAREISLTAVKEFFSSEPSVRALKQTQLDPAKIEQAVTLLDDQELAQLAVQAMKAQKDTAVGALNNQQLTYIIIALATAVVVILIVGR